MVGKIRYYSSIDPAVLEILTLEYNAVAGHQLAHIGQLDLRAKDRLGARIHDYLAAYDRDGAAPADYIIDIPCSRAAIFRRKIGDFSLFFLNIPKRLNLPI